MQQFFPHRHSFSPAAQHLDPQRAFRGAKLPAHFAVALPVENQRPEATAFRRRRFENSQQEPLRFGTNDPTQRRRLVARLGLGKILREQRFVEASDRALERAIKLKRASEARAGVGLATQLDVLRADLMVSQAQASLASQRESLAGRLDQLKLLMGRHMDSPIEIAGDDLVELTREADGFVESPPAIPPTPVGLSRSNRERPTRLNVASYSDRTRIDELAALARSARLDVREAADRVGDARRHQTVARWNLLPQVNLTASYARRGLGSPSSALLNDLLGGWRVGLTTGYSLDRAGELAASATASVSVQAAERALEELAERVAVEVRRAVRGIERADTSIAIHAKAVELAEKQLTLAQLRYERGLAGNFDVIDAESNLYQAQSALISTEVDRALAALALAKAIGTLDPERLLR